MPPFGCRDSVDCTARRAESPPVITVSTDGSCLRNPGGAIGWAWANHDGTSASGGPVQNLALIQSIDAAIAERVGAVSFVWVRGHRGDEFNERADELAGIAARGMQDVPDEVPAALVPEPDVLF